MNNFKKLRDNKSQALVASELGISQRAYSNYENGTREPDFTTLAKIADHFGVSIDYLLGREQSQYENKTKNPITEDRLLKLGFDKDKIEQLTDEDLIRIRAYIEGMLDSKK